MNKKKIQSIIESLLFVSGEPISLKRMCSVIRDAERSEVQAALDKLIKSWDRPERGLRLVDVSGGYQLQTVADNSPWVGKLLQSRPVRLSRPSLETLAIVAYKQPVTRPEIEEVRGVDSGGVLKTLLEHGFLKIAGRKDVPGKPLIYATDRRFMEFFRLKSLSELPTLKELSEIQEENLEEAEKQGILPLEDASGEPDADAPESTGGDENLESEAQPKPEPSESDPGDSSDPEKQGNEDGGPEN